MDSTPSAPQRNTFRKAERLCLKKDLDRLFTAGQSIRTASFRLIWIDREGHDVPARMAFSVPKKNLKKAVQRNLVKRRMREAYRQHKGPVHNSLQTSDRSVDMVLIFTGHEPMPFAEVEGKIILILQRFTNIACGKQ